MIRCRELCAVILVIALVFSMSACTGKGSESEKKEFVRYEPVSVLTTNVDPGEETHLMPTEGAAKEKKRDITLLVYMIGADLESKTAAATSDIEEMISCGFDPKDVNLLVYTGGCQYWHNGIPTDANYLYRCDSAAGELTQTAHTDQLYSMANAQTLTDVLDHVAEYYPAEHFGLLFWDHGTGSVIGYGNDQLFEKDSLNLQELSAALYASAFGKTQHFDFIGFDACLMGSLETAITVAPFSDYLIASEETEPGTGWDYSVFAEISAWDDPIQIARQIIDSYAKDENKKSRFVPDRTLSCMDLSKTGDVIAALDTLCTDMRQNRDEDFAIVSRLRNQIKEFAPGNRLDQVDLGHFASLAEMKWEASAKALRQAIDDMVVYQTANVANACGVSFYFPYSGASLYEERGTGSLQALYNGRNYSSFIDDFLSYVADGKQDSHGLGDYEETEESFVLKLSDTDRNVLASAYYSVYEKAYDGSYLPLITEVALEPNENGELKIPLNPKCIYWTNAEGDKQLCPARMIESTDDRMGFSVEFSACTDTAYAPYNERQECEARLMIPPGKTEAVIQNILLASDNSFVDRNELHLENYSHLWINFYNGSKPKRNKDGALLPFREWESESTFWFSFCPIGTDYGFVLDDLDNTMDDHVIQLTVKDIFGNEFSSELMTAVNTAQSAVVKQDVPGGTATYCVYEDHAELSLLEGEIKDLNVPSHVEGRPVTLIKAHYFNEDSVITTNNSYLETVTLPDTVRVIANQAFDSCTNLRQVQLGSGLVSIGSSAFALTSLEEIRFPDTLEYIGMSAFYNCSNLSFDENFESYYTGLSEIKLPSGIKEIGEGAFAGCKNLKSITIEGSSAYQSQDGVLFTADGKTLVCYPAGKAETSYNVPDSVERIGVGAFYSAQPETINCGNSLREIAPYAFYYNKKLEQCILPDTLESIGAYAFGNDSFFGVSSYFDTHPEIQNMYIGPAVSRIGEAAFLGARVKEFTVSENNRSYSANGNMLLDKSGTVLLCVDTSDEGTFTVPDGIVTLASNALSGCSQLTGLVLPDSVMNMEFQTLNLDRIEIGAGLKNVSDVGFFSNTNLEIVLSPENPYLQVVDGNLVQKKE